MILALSMDASKWGSAVVKRLSGTGSVRMVALQEDERFRTLCGRDTVDRAAARCEQGIVSLAAFLCPENIRPFSGEPLPGEAGTPGGFRQWHRRGRDPEKLRKLFPAASFDPDRPSPPDAAAGKALYTAVLKFLTDDLTPFFTAGDNASR